MPSFWLLKLALNGIDLLSWPLLALVYPLCASIQAIESDSHSDTRNLISYWILLSLIYLFEYAFLSLLQWFEYWAYMKLMMIVWLVIPDFGRASYVYNHFVRSCFSMNSQAVISKFRNWKKIFVKKENFLMQAENYIKENGTEALEELISSKIMATYLNKEAIKIVPAREKNEMPQANNVKLQVEQKGIKVLEMIETDQVIPEGKKDNTEIKVKENTTNTSSTVMETEGTAGNNTAGGESPQICESKKVQKEWTCAICQVKTTSENNLKSHFYGSKHKAACEALKAKNKEKQNKSKGVHGNTKVQEMQKSRLRCEMCNVNCTSKVDMVSHINGKRHLAQIQVGPTPGVM